MRLRTEWADHAAQGGEVPRVTPDLRRLAAPPGAQVTWLGHSCFLVQRGGVNLLTDPVFSERASPVSFAGPRRYTPNPASAEELPPLHAVVISHNHYDHLDTHTIAALAARSPEALWLVPLANRALLEGAGVDPARVVELDWWQARALKVGDTEVRLTPTPAQHWSARGLFDRNEALWASWAAEWVDPASSSPEGRPWRVFFGGDTGYNELIFKEIGTRLGPFDLGLIPIGAYAPREFMRTMHVDPAEGVRIHHDVGARLSVGAHWGAFPLTAEPVMEPPARLREALRAAGVPALDFVTLALGETRGL
ncbi:MAG: MBL fold metallo-hydrolase [Deltaproteobacteria bacterium]|nr:MBL fold metallo-hydrolase [Deltaproteobacteria bacterium]